MSTILEAFELSRIDTKIDGIDEDNYAYAYCECPYPSNICYRISKLSTTRFCEFICPECMTKIGVLVTVKKKGD